MKKKPCILYVDDEELNLMLFEINFQRNYEIITSASGVEGLEKIRSINDIKVVISDMRMPGMNGIEFIRQAKTEFPGLFCFILTGYDITKEIADALNERLIVKYLRKPFNVKEIEQSIKDVLR
jgi:two-component system, response regulator, stage 0 sporulation protein F